MPLFSFIHQTKVLIVACAIVLGVTGLAQARDENDRPLIRRSHHEHVDRQRDGPVDLRNDNRNRRSAARRALRRDQAEWRRDGDRHTRRERRRDSRWNTVDDGFPAIVPGVGTYAGGLSAFREPGNGIYIRSENETYGGYDDAPSYRSRSGKVIVITPGSATRSCAWQSGVCIVRGR